jgi:hypothetical protein
MTLDEQLRFVKNETWQVRVGQVASRVALAVQAESTGTTNHAARSALAVKVLTESDPKVWSVPFTKNVAAVNNFPAEPNDAQLQTAVQAVWNPMSGVTT